MVSRGTGQPTARPGSPCAGPVGTLWSGEPQRWGLSSCGELRALRTHPISREPQHAGCGHSVHDARSGLSRQEEFCEQPGGIALTRKTPSRLHHIWGHKCDCLLFTDPQGIFAVTSWSLSVPGTQYQTLVTYRRGEFYFGSLFQSTAAPPQGKKARWEGLAGGQLLTSWCQEAEGRATNPSWPCPQAPPPDSKSATVPVIQSPSRSPALST